METKVEVDAEGKPVRVYHRAGTVDERKDEKYAWTHPIAEQETCEACTKGRIPKEVTSERKQEGR
jgi:hypothetical protein